MTVDFLGVKEYIGLYNCTCILGVRMEIVIDTSAVIAVILDEPEKGQLIKLTDRVDLLAPASLPWEVGNAFSAIFKRQRLTADQAVSAMRVWQKIPIRVVQIDVLKAVQLANQLQIYAYDAYFIETALLYKASLLSLDSGLCVAARKVGIQTIEVNQ